MASYDLAGSGVQELSAGVGLLRINVSVPPASFGVGRAYPRSWYDVGLLRPMDDIDSYRPIPIDAEDMALAVPTGITHLGYSLFGGAHIHVVEVIGTSPFAGPIGPEGPTGPAGPAGSATLADLTDVLVAAVADGDILQYVASASRWENVPPSGGGGLYSAYLCYQDQKSSGTVSGQFFSGAWRTRDLNTEVADTGGHGAIAANQITLDAGTYRVFASAPAYTVGRNATRLQDITGGVTLADGSLEYAQATNGATSTRSTVVGRFTLAVSSVVELQHRCESTSINTYGFGVDAGTMVAVPHETYASVELWKEI